MNSRPERMTQALSEVRHTLLANPVFKERADMRDEHRDLRPVKARHYATGLPIRVVLEEGSIATIENLNEEPNDHLPMIAPGLVDLQINGYKKLDFNQPTLHANTVKRVTAELWNEGVTTYLPTVITNTFESIHQAVLAIANACEEDESCAAGIAGIHLEGPFISPVDGPRGAHRKGWVTTPNWEWFERWQEAAGGRIRILTLSPEWPEAIPFIEKCVASGVIVSIGHTAADALQIQEAVAAGASMSTHLGNGAHLVLPRHPNYIWDQLADSRLSAGLIADGFHLPEALLKVFRKVKGNKAFIVSDADSLGGMPPGTYRYDAHDDDVVKTVEGKLHIAGNPKLLAGSAQMQLWGIRHLVRSHICTLSEAWDMASVIPAGIMKLPEERGLSVGAAADLVLFEWEQEEREIRVTQTYKSGKPCFTVV